MGPETNLSNQLESGKTKITKAIGKEIFSQGLSILAVAFPQAINGKEKIKLIQNLLSDLSEDQFVKAVKTFCLRHKELYPNSNIIAYLREYAFENINRKTGMEAWEDVGVWLKNRSYPISAEALEVAESMGRLNLIMSDNPSIDRAQFIKAYDRLIEKNKIIGQMGENDEK